jgi:diguanylate cyclase (GGDEF)-like protein/PAS domain S-box-containing protein
VRQDPRSLGRLSVEMAVRAARGEEVSSTVQTEVALVTRERVAEASLATLPLFPRVLSDLTRSNSALAEERSLLRTLIDNLPDLIYVKDHAGRFVLANSSVLRLVGARSEEEVIGKTDFDFFPPELAAQYYADEQAIIASGEPLISQEERTVDAAGESRWVSTTKVLARDSIGSFVGLVGMNRDITEHKRLQEEALHDRLTGLPNRALLADRIDHALARQAREELPVALLFIDLDNFKAINDSLGHQVGDELLVAVAARLSQTARPGDTVARYGGDEFIFLCENLADPEAIYGIADRVACALGEPVELTAGTTVRVTASIGIALTAGKRTTADALIRDADAAMYRAKANGRPRDQLDDGNHASPATQNGSSAGRSRELGDIRRA